jgi:hypothetical protein
LSPLRVHVEKESDSFSLKPVYSEIFGRDEKKMTSYSMVDGG